MGDDNDSNAQHFRIDIPPHVPPYCTLHLAFKVQSTVLRTLFLQFLPMSASSSPFSHPARSLRSVADDERRSRVTLQPGSSRIVWLQPMEFRQARITTLKSNLPLFCFQPRHPPRTLVWPYSPSSARPSSMRPSTSWGVAGLSTGAGHIAIGTDRWLPQNTRDPSMIVL